MRSLRFLNRNPRIATRLNLTSIAVINDFISMDDGATFIGVNRCDADFHVAGGVRNTTATLYALRHDPDLVLLRRLRHRCLESLPRER